MEWLPLIADNSVDSIVDDPPAGIGFMGKEWDRDKGGRDAWIAWLTEIKRECLRVLKPGGHMLTWALPRTSHWTATAIEDAGFEIRDLHHDIVSRHEEARDFIRSLDAEQRRLFDRLLNAAGEASMLYHVFGSGFPKSLTPKSAPLPSGTGTALKPAVEHWILARKPLEGTVGANLARHGTGTLNIEACRIGTSKDVPASAARDRIGQIAKGDERGRTTDTPGFDPNIGRWPAHLSLDEAGAAALDEQSGVSSSSDKPRRNGAFKSVAKGAECAECARVSVGHADHGGASRFFYVAKPPRSERDAGLDDHAATTGGEATGRKDGTAGTRNPRAGAGRTGGAKNIHPTVKSIALMRWLVRLITPPGGLVLDEFSGSGSTGLACAAEGMRFLGIEREPSKPGAPDYHGIALARLRRAFGRVATELPEQRALDALLTPRRPVAQPIPDSTDHTGETA